MPRFHNINGKQVQFTSDEEIAKDKREEENNIVIQARINEVTNNETKKASGKQKLKDLGLDDDEIKALIGA